MLDVILLPLILVLVVFSAIVGIWEIFTYIGMSWARRRNSKDFNGVQNADAIFAELGDDIKAKKSFWSFSYVAYSVKRKVLRIGLIDSRRKSLWTVATTGRQAYSAHVIERAQQGEKPPVSIFWFRLQTYWFGIFVSFLFNILIIASVSMWALSTSDGENVFNVWFLIFLTTLFVLPLLMTIASFKTSKVMIENVDKIFGNIYTAEEVAQIRKLWKLEYIKSIIDLIKIVLVMVYTLLKAAAASKKDN